tara:strand:- start:11930 stop:15856 length:3927 start_codon:yes stop_codon:yes gene_type:complete
MSGKTYLRNPNFFKRNYFEALKYILPAYLYDDDREDHPKVDDTIDLIINNHIDVADNFSSILNVSAVPNSSFSAINTFEGIAPYFVKQNELTNITTQEFQDNVLSYFNVKFQDFGSDLEFSSYLNNTLLKAINLNDPDTTVFGDLGEASAIHNYLISNLSWVYFLNTSGPSYDPSSYVRDLLVSSVYIGKPIRIDDGIKGLSENIWRNGSGAYYPSALFASGSREDLSGTQQLEKLQTWNEVIYSPLFADSSDFRVRDKFETYRESTLKSTQKVEDGPFARLIRALSFFAFDINNDSEKISTLYDIEDCPDEFLPLVAQLIGWDLFGNNPDKWRLQLRNAAAIYKTVGTKKSIQSTVNSIFPKNKFPIESRLTELWESYVPYLIYYSLATESPKFKSFKTYTPADAAALKIEKYSISSMDDNIRLAVDQILLEIIREFPDNFPINSWLSEFDGKFNYRGRDFSIPPFEEYPYYVNTELDAAMVTFIADRLACYGVDNDFALDVSSYITSKALSNDDEPKLGSWLIFTSGYNEPPNIDKLLRNLNDNRFDYASLWSGKSSHFKLVLDASEFDFNKTGFGEADTGDAVKFVSKAANKFAPAHAIPLISLEVSADPDYLPGFEASCLPHVYFDYEEIDVAAGDNHFTSGIYLNTYKRGLNTSPAVGRSATNSLASPELQNVSSIGSVPRNSSRRRSYEKVMPFNGYYDRTGFNMPVSFNSASSLSGIPLGLTPSSLTYTPVTSVINLPPIWAQCEGLNSDNTYYEYDVSNTQNIRGQSANFQANTDRTTDRGQLPGIYAAMHRIKENHKILVAESAVSSTLENDKDLVLSYVASANNGLLPDSDTVFSFPRSTQDYYNFEFGRDLHRLYRTYQQTFNWHRLSEEVQDQDGANIFSHVFGPILYNHNLQKLNTDNNVASSFSSPKLLTVGDDLFTGPRSFAASADTDMYLNTPERVVSGLVEGVELVLASGAGADSSFSVINVPGSTRASFEDKFLFDRTLLIMRSGVGNAATRVRFDISKYAADSFHPISNNFLMPEHEFEVSLSSLVSEDSGQTLGGRGIGVWIHTKPESGKMWSFTQQGSWVQHDQLISRLDMISKFSHINSTPFIQKGSVNSSNSNLVCLSQTPANRTSPVIGLSSTDFNNFTINFNTKNHSQKLPDDYQRQYDQLHRLDQNYVVEVFVLPGGSPDSFMLVDSIAIQDKTLKKLSEIFLTGTRNNPLCVFKKDCVENRMELSKADLFDIFKHFNNIAGKNAATAYASRDKYKTETIMESEGGSRIDYRYVNELATILFATDGGGTPKNLAVNIVGFDV